MLYDERECCEQEEHLERWEVGRLHAVQVVVDHVTRAQYQVADGAEHAAIADAPHIEKQQESVLERETADAGRLSTARTVVALIGGAA